MDFRFFKENIMDGQKHSSNVIGPRQFQGPPVSFHTTYRFLKHNTYKFYFLSCFNYFFHILFISNNRIV